MSARKKPRVSAATHRVCPHCDKELNIKTYRAHRRLYFDSQSKSWLIAGTESASVHKPKATSLLSVQEEIIDPPGDATDDETNTETDYMDVDVLLECDQQSELDSDHAHLQNTDLPIVQPHSHMTNPSGNIADVEPQPEYWLESDKDITADIEPPQTLDVNAATNSEQDKSSRSIVWWIVLFVNAFQTLHVISDQAIAWLLKFLWALLKFLGTYSPVIAKASKNFPSSLYLRDKLNAWKDNFLRYVVCRKCHALYKYQECIEVIGTRRRGRLCSHSSFSSVCGGLLLKEVISPSGNITFYPHSVFCYKSVIDAMQEFVSRPGFADICESTRDLYTRPGICDVYQGQIWKDFLKINGRNFLLAPYVYGFMLNVDWFKPFKHGEYKVGVIYLAVLNLPRETRYKRENIIVIGIIPGPSEPAITINSYLHPLVTELLKLWNGVQLNIHSKGRHIVRAALLSIGCDLPAARKTCGFLSYVANLGCSRCYVNFSGGFGRRNYSNFRRESWNPRTNAQHRADVEKIKKCKTLTERLKMESELECRYSVLLQLPYFDPIRMLQLDPMHNLYLGTSKMVIRKVLIERNILSPAKVAIINRRLKRIHVPIEIGRVPVNIQSGDTFTAEQWMNWTMYFSVYCLFDLLTPNEIECWRHFVLACRRLYKKKLTVEDVTVSDALLIKFCSRMCQLYGCRVATPNMHMHGHMASFIRDYGPIHAFWLFSFERYNGLLGKQPNNNKAIEIQLMRRFLRDNAHLSLLHEGQTQVQEFHQAFFDVVVKHAQSFDSMKVASTDADTSHSTPSKFNMITLGQDELQVLLSMYRELYPQHKDKLFLDGLPKCAKKYNHITLNNSKLSSKDYVLAEPVFMFPGDSEIKIRPAKVVHFVMHSLFIDDERKCTLLAVVQWPLNHPRQNAMGKPVEIWCKCLYEPYIKNLFVPVERIARRVMYAYEPIDGEEVLVVIPII